MTLYQVAVYHNTAAWFMPYRPEDPLMLVFTFDRDLPDDNTAEQVADSTSHTFNVDLEVLENDRATPPGAETAFPLACLYRLLRLRSISTGDVVPAIAEGYTTWLACEPFGWRRIDTPVDLSGLPLTAATVYQHLRRGHDV
jgi:hypothetical protein